MSKLPPWQYRLSVLLIAPLVLLHLMFRSFRDGGQTYFLQRLGFVPKDKTPRIHLHAASVGEVITALPLIEKLQSTHSDMAFLVTTNTPTGFSLLNERLQGKAVSAYLPLDYRQNLKRFHNRVSITDLWIIETEIWPWLYAEARSRRIPVVLINARLSLRSEGRLANLFAKSYEHALQDTRVLTRSVDDVERFIARGAQPHNVVHIGNLKLGQQHAQVESVQPIDTPYCLAASTHDDEELQLAQAWLQNSDLGLLVIAPRHPERGARLLKSLSALQAELDQNLPPPAQRSKNEFPSEQSRLYLADTIGELPNWYAHSQAAFVGGSLIERGGHNVLEAARVSTPIIVGPHYYNFSEEVDLLRAAEGIAIAENADEVVKLFGLAQENTDWACQLGEKAKNAIPNSEDIIDTYCVSLDTHTN